LFSHRARVDVANQAFTRLDALLFLNQGCQVADPRYTAFKQFLALRCKDIQRIASHTRNEYTVADVENEAWLIASDLVGDEDFTAHFLNPEFQGTLLRYLYQQLVKYKERKFRNPVRLDQKDDDGPDQYDLLGGAGNNDTPDPLAILIASEDAPPGNDEPNPHDTQAGAYVHLLRRHKGSIRDLAEYLRISVSHCYRCIARARELARYQSALSFSMARDDMRIRRWRNFRVRGVARRLDSGLQGRLGRLL
jgi:hypothetical protein